MSIFEGEGDFTAETTHGPPREPAQWQVGDRVRVVGGSRLLLGATGTVVEVDVFEAGQVRVDIDRAGFGRALLASHELEPADGTTS
ncbi:hypothetical protein [Myceligenerans pegani]|uniref:DUF3553 domain-containing protein n=1 Tax=Myceligenerans pegani TaxID=2776917 RepID=A0ABR9N6U3_9MICO|nr:hypothetical protein [Myceligenerans sp. TRM 65318]MBE1878858.1 hypothetical protein [Myceligenerans sp. TRM 65318]MBE3021129.1 hypothetical protein [Myceligenerans sp. TRM 65318]